MDSYRNMTCILKVDTQTSGWEKSVTKVIKRIKGNNFHTLQSIYLSFYQKCDPNS
ncbi:hypothetical protein MTR_7g109950 [Medicago truncatula]|uniref:Uncharacterized protein n=1 Tax=Medicago truncatula TaxID=3880 RepID=G7KTP6_MEDTR|nr:hypothetical protein MTR_7g109950 [Medicago truncatula]